MPNSKYVSGANRQRVLLATLRLRTSHRKDERLTAY